MVLVVLHDSFLEEGYFDAVCLVLVFVALGADRHTLVIMFECKLKQNHIYSYTLDKV